jgi:hypothetical protein
MSLLNGRSIICSSIVLIILVSASLIYSESNLFWKNIYAQNLTGTNNSTGNTTSNVSNQEVGVVKDCVPQPQPDGGPPDGGPPPESC